VVGTTKTQAVLTVPAETEEMLTLVVLVAVTVAATAAAVRQVLLVVREAHMEVLREIQDIVEMLEVRAHHHLQLE